MSHLCRFPFQLKPGLLETNIRMNFGEDYLNPENSVSFYRSISFQHNDALTFINSTIALKVQNKPFDNKKIYVGFRILYIWSWLQNDKILLRIFKLFKYFFLCIFSIVVVTSIWKSAVIFSRTVGINLTLALFFNLYLVSVRLIHRLFHKQILFALQPT